MTQKQNLPFGILLASKRPSHSLIPHTGLICRRVALLVWLCSGVSFIIHTRAISEEQCMHGRIKAQPRDRGHALCGVVYSCRGPRSVKGPGIWKIYWFHSITDLLFSIYTSHHCTAADSEPQCAQWKTCSGVTSHRLKHLTNGLIKVKYSYESCEFLYSVYMSCSAGSICIEITCLSSSFTFKGTFPSHLIDLVNLFLFTLMHISLGFVTATREVMFPPLFVSLFVSSITQKQLSGFLWNFVEGCGAGQARSYYILVLGWSRNLF